jgi:hypothetical protein
MALPIFWTDEYLKMRNEPSQIVLNFKEGIWSQENLFLTERDINKLFPRITFSHQKDKLLSPFSATYGGIYYGPDSEFDFTVLVTKLNEYLTSLKLNEVKITLPPSHITDTKIINELVFLQNSWKKSIESINHFIELDKWSVNEMSKGNRKKLRQCQETELSFMEGTPDDLAAAYQVIDENRKILGIKVSLRLDELRALLLNFPKKYSCYILKNHTGEIVASAFLVETSAENLYVYLWADNPKFRHLSPLVYLMNEIITVSKSSYRYLDLGTSSIGGYPLEGLVRFKDNLGAKRSKKQEISWTGLV